VPRTFREKRFYVCILASMSGTLYIGITNDLARRVYEHKEGLVSSFTAKYRVDRLVYFETFKYVGNAIAREKELKGWLRAKKIKLIESVNPSWRDLSRDWERSSKVRPGYRGPSRRAPSPAKRARLRLFGMTMLSADS